MRARGARRGFTLVEVATSLGVISFVLVALIGMIPVGLENGRHAMGDTHATQLLKMLAATLESEPFTAADCFMVEPTASSRVDFTKIGTDAVLSPAPDLVLYASYDVRALPRLERTGDGRLPAEAIYRLELRCRRESITPVGGAARVVGSNVNVRIFPVRGTRPIGEAWTYIPRFQRTTLPPLAASTAGAITAHAP